MENLQGISSSPVNPHVLQISFPVVRYSFGQWFWLLAKAPWLVYYNQKPQSHTVKFCLLVFHVGVLTFLMFQYD